jgi:hypothetical protein
MIKSLSYVPSYDGCIVTGALRELHSTLNCDGVSFYMEMDPAQFFGQFDMISIKRSDGYIEFAGQGDPRQSDGNQDEEILYSLAGFCSRSQLRMVTRNNGPIRVKCFMLTEHQRNQLAWERRNQLI